MTRAEKFEVLKRGWVGFMFSKRAPESIANHDNEIQDFIEELQEQGHCSCAACKGLKPVDDTPPTPECKPAKEPEEVIHYYFYAGEYLDGTDKVKVSGMCSGSNPADVFDAVLTGVFKSKNNGHISSFTRVE